jgi:hypothetical protein
MEQYAQIFINILAKVTNPSGHEAATAIPKSKGL